MKELRKREIKTGVITTKGKIFAEKILKELNIFPEFIFGYESGTKIKIAEKLTQTYEILGFIEDRKKTLIDIKQNSETSHIPCFLADWGYLKESDKNKLSNEIKLLKLGNLEELVAI
jgi:phosphoglycolate phosphatase-like HAD superfamily hydrolase